MENPSAPAYSPPAQELWSTIHSKKTDFYELLRFAERAWGISPTVFKNIIIKFIQDNPNGPVLSAADEEAYSAPSAAFSVSYAPGNIDVPVTEDYNEGKRWYAIAHYVDKIPKIIPLLQASGMVFEKPSCYQHPTTKVPYMHYQWKTYWLLRMLLAAARDHIAIVQNDHAENLATPLGIAFTHDKVTPVIAKIVEEAVHAALVRFHSGETGKVLIKADVREALAECIPNQ